MGLWEKIFGKKQKNAPGIEKSSELKRSNTVSFKNEHKTSKDLKLSMHSKKSSKKANDKRQEQVLARRKKIYSLLNKFMIILKNDNSETFMVEHYLREIDLALEDEYNIFKNIKEDLRNEIDIGAFEDVSDEAITLWKPTPGGLIATVSSALYDFMISKDISENDKKYSIFGSKKINKLMINCNKKYKDWMAKNAGIDYDGNRAMMGLRNLYSDLRKMKTLEDAKKLYNGKSFINSYYSEIISSLISILDGLERKKMKSFVSNFDNIRKKLEDANKAISKK